MEVERCQLKRKAVTQKGNMNMKIPELRLGGKKEPAQTGAGSNASPYD